MAFSGDALPTMAFAGSPSRPTADRTVILPGASPTPATSDRTVILPGGPAAQTSDRTVIQPGGPASQPPDRTVIDPGGPSARQSGAAARPFAGLAELPSDRTVRAPPAGATVDRAVRQPGITIDRAVRLGAPPLADRTVVLPGPDADDEPPEGATVVDPRSPRRAAPARDDQTMIVPRGAPDNQETMIIAAGAPNNQETMIIAADAAPGSARPPAPVPERRWPLKKTLIVVNVATVLLLLIVLLSR
jgi:hypothetical protein